MKIFKRDKSFAELAKTRSEADWILKISDVARGDRNMYQRLLRIVWWDICDYSSTEVIKTLIEDNDVDIDAIDAKSLHQSLMKIGYPQQFADLRCSCYIQKYVPKHGHRGRPRKQPPEDEK